MKVPRYKGEHVDSMLPPSTGMGYEQTNKTNYNKSRTMVLTCPVCYISFNRSPSHSVTKTYPCTCSRACAHEVRRVRVVVNCIVCDKSMELTPSNVPRIRTCSIKCKRLKTVKDPETIKKYRFNEYRRRIRKITKQKECKNCGRRHGPWSVRGFEISMLKNGTLNINDENAELWCRSCHLRNLNERHQ